MMATPRPLPPRSVRTTEGAAGLSDGFVVKASVVARVLGFRLLTLDASVAVAPAATDPPQALETTHRRLESRDHVVAHNRSGAIGSELAAATRMIGEGEGRVAAVRRNGSGA